MGLDKFVTGIILFIMMVMGSIFFISDLNTNYEGVNIDSSELQEFNSSTGKLINLSDSMSGFIIGGEIDDDTTENSMFKGVFSSLRLITIPFEIAGELLLLFVSILGIPPIFQSLTVLLISIFIIFGLIFIIMRIKG